MKKTRRNVWCNRILCLLAVGMLITGCGKSEAEQAAEYYREEYGMSEESAQQLADSFFGEETKETERMEDEVEQNEFKIYDPLPEMLSSKVGDGLVQIHDTLIYENGTMTVKDCVEVLSNGAEAENYYYFRGHDEMKTDELINAQTEGEIKLSYGNSWREDKMICTLMFYNPTSDYLNLEECIITEVKDKHSYKDYETMQCFNVIHAGCLRLVRLGDLAPDSSYYEKVTEQVISYENLDTYLLSQGYEANQVLPSPNASFGENRIITKPVKTQMKEEKEYCYFIYDFKVSNADRMIMVNKHVCYGNEDAISGPLVYTEQATQEEWGRIIEEIKVEIAEINYVETSLLEYQGKIIGPLDSTGGTKVFMIFKESDSVYYLASPILSVGMHDNLVRNWFAGSEMFDSIEEAIANVNELHGEEIRETSFGQ